MSNPNIRLSSQQCRLMERTSREMTAIVNVQDRFIATLQGLLNTLPCPEQAVLLRQSRALLESLAQCTADLTSHTVFNNCFLTLIDVTAFYLPLIRLSPRTSSVTCGLRRSWPRTFFALRLFRRHVQR